MSNLKEVFKKNKKTILILALIILVGIFLRTYNFHDWLRFSHDQARDQWIISKALDGKPLPLLGPNAGTTAYQLGPVYYYFSYFSEKIFGNYPDKMAYPSVFFSILSLPLLFFFLRNFFCKNISLAMTAIASVSYFLVINSRFSSNPNLITFFVLLYLFALLKILNESEKKYFYIWSILAGIGMGVSIQLHTTLLIALPIVTLCTFIYLLKNKHPDVWKCFFLILATVLIINSSQIYHELKSNGSNTRLFFKGFQKTSDDNNLGKKVFLIASCQLQANTHILSSFQDDDRCSTILHAPTGKEIDKYIYYLGTALTILFSLAGYFLLWERFQKEKEKKKKNFLGLVILFNLVSFVILIPIANIIYVGYFINLFFIPFILLGLIIQEIQEKYGKIGTNIAIVAVIFFIACCISRDASKAKSYFDGLENNSENSTLSQVELIRDYIFSNSKGNDDIYFSGQDDLKNRFFYPLEYFAREKGRKIEKIDLDAKDIDKVEQIFYIDYKKTNSEQTTLAYPIISSKDFSKQTIFILKP